MILAPRIGRQHAVDELARDVDEGVGVEDVDRADGAAGDAGLVGDGADEILRPRPLVAADVDEEADHARFAAGTASRRRDRGKGGDVVFLLLRRGRAAGLLGVELEDRGGDLGGVVLVGQVVDGVEVAGVAVVLRSSTARICCFSASRRRSATSASVGRRRGSIRARVMRSIWRSQRTSRGVTRVIASPARPARPVRPMRWT